VNQENERLMEEYERLASDLLEWIRRTKVIIPAAFLFIASVPTREGHSESNACLSMIIL